MSIWTLGFDMRDVGVPFLLAMGTSAPGAGQMVGYLPIIAINLIMYFIVFRPMKSQQQKVQAFRDGLKAGDKVVTSGGLYGLITKVGEQSVQLQVADKVRVEISRNAVVGFQGQEPVEEASSSVGQS